MFAQLDEIEPGDAERLSAVWERLATFLEIHAEAATSRGRSTRT
jgi:hypothetical protein